MIWRIYNFVSNEMHLHDEYSKINDEISIVVNTEDIFVANSFNDEQRSTYGQILNKVFSCDLGIFFIDSPRGSGNKYLYRTILPSILSKGLVAIAIAF